VTVAGRTAATLKETVRLIEASGGSARYVVADITDESQVEKAVQAAVADTGRLDLALNNAGYTASSSSPRTTPARCSTR
jgi:NAD(P)-dependent dehydrogenase (short-subunit alcohol dehydrogenase family)